MRQKGLGWILSRSKPDVHVLERCMMPKKRRLFPCRAKSAKPILTPRSIFLTFPKVKLRWLVKRLWTLVGIDYCEKPFSIGRANRPDQSPMDRLRVRPKSIRLDCRLAIIRFIQQGNYSCSKKRGKVQMTARERFPGFQIFGRDMQMKVDRGRSLHSKLRSGVRMTFQTPAAGCLY